MAQGKPKRDREERRLYLLIFTIATFVGVHYLPKIIHAFWISLCVVVALITLAVTWSIEYGLGAGFFVYFIGILINLLLGLGDVISDIQSSLKKSADEQREAETKDSWSPPPVPPAKP